MRQNRTAPDAGLHELEYIAVLSTEHRQEKQVVASLKSELDVTKRRLRFTRIERTACLVMVFIAPGLASLFERIFS